MSGEGAGPGQVVLVATPIGNLGDLSPRAVETLRDADVVCCEDTRRARALLSAAGVPGGHRLVSLHGHNEAARTVQVLGWVAEGRTVAVVSDAGMPGISDPGARLVSAAASQGLAVSVVPGPSAILAALVVSGLPTDRFCFEGFLPRRGAERRRAMASLAGERRTAVVLESPSRVATTLADLVTTCGGDRPVAVVRELTKVDEEVWRGTLAEAAARSAVEPPRGEVVLVVGGSPGPPAPTDDQVSSAVAGRLAAGDSPRQVAEDVAALLDVPRRRAYQAAIRLRSAGEGPAPTGGA